MNYELNRLYNEDCLEAMKKIPDKFFELAIVDPPYGGGNNNDWETKPRSRFGGTFNKYEIKSNINSELGTQLNGSGRSQNYVKSEIKANRTGGQSKGWGKVNANKKISHWDIAPPPEYFKELFRVSKNQIIWGGNYFELPPTRCFVIWRKPTVAETFSMAMCEYAWTSFNANAKFVEMASQDKKRFHPTQKPVALYTWLLNNYAKSGDKILDTHAGSASSAIACIKAGFEWIAFEIDEDYYKKAQKRIDEELNQMTLFEIFDNK